MTHGAWALRDRPAVVWLLAAVIVALAHRQVPESGWLMVHLVLLGALTHSAMVWSTHFTQALLKTPPTLDDRAVQSRRLGLLLLGTALVLVGVPTGIWLLTLIGAVIVAVAVSWHAIQLARRLKVALPGRFRVTVRYYLLAAACLPIGVGLGAVLARGLDDSWHSRFLIAHLGVNLLGWIGLTMTGTLITLWPTMLRTRIDPRGEQLARQALPVLAGGVLVLSGGALLGWRLLALGGLLGYAAGLVWWGRALVRPARTAPPREFATASVAAALLWLAVGLVAVGWRLGMADSWGVVMADVGGLSAVFVAGFAVQLLTGALSYLLPSVLGGGPSVVRAGQRWFDRWATVRLIIINLGLLLFLLPVPSAVRLTSSLLVLIAVAAFVPLMLTGIQAAVRARRARDEQPAGAMRPAGTRPHRPSIWSAGQAVAALSALAVAVSLGVGYDPAAAGLAGPGGAGTSATGGPATGHTTTVRVVADGMRFEPSSVTVPAGDRLVVELVNQDPTTTHDLTLGGETTPRLRPGQSATLDLGVVGGPLDGWCTVIGHRQMGMTFTVQVTGKPAAPAAGTSPSEAAPDGGPAPAGLLPHDPGASAIQPVDAELSPLTDERVHRITLTVEELPLEVAPGVWQQRWTYNGQVPAPTLHGRVGDVFEVTLVNDGTMGHSLDFHAGALAPDEPMRTIPPGESLVYRFTADRAGIWMYHCATEPMSSHIAAGLHGAVVIEPDGLPEVDRSYVLVQSEVYLQDRASSAKEATGVNADAVLAERPDAVVFNGIAWQYDATPFTAKVGERVRFWVLDAGPNRPTSFHIVGGQFDTVYSEGAYLLGGPGSPADASGGSQALGLQAAQGGFVELTFPEAGHYPVISHVMVDAERGAHGIVEVTGR